MHICVPFPSIPFCLWNAFFSKYSCFAVRKVVIFEGKQSARARGEQRLWDLQLGPRRPLRLFQESRLILPLSSSTSSFRGSYFSCSQSMFRGSYFSSVQKRGQDNAVKPRVVLQQYYKSHRNSAFSTWRRFCLLLLECRSLATRCDVRGDNFS